MYKLSLWFIFPGSAPPARVQSRNQGILCGEPSAPTQQCTNSLFTSGKAQKCDENKILRWTQLIMCTWVKGQSAQLFVRGCYAWHSAHRGSHLSSDLSYDAPTHHHHLWSAAPGWWHVKLVKINNQVLLICCSLNPDRNCRINYKRSFREKAESWSLKEISLLPRTIKPSTLTGFMFAPPHDGFYSTVISEHVKYHREQTIWNMFKPATESLHQYLNCVICTHWLRRGKISWE